ncbi:MAG: sodium/proline symporter PutP [Clostridiales bacterium]|nr:sodium/proline symporter PutP [Clostridiales bacterium]
MKLFAFILYFAVVLGIGVYFFLRTKSASSKDYFLGGRSMGPWVTAMSAQASDMSGWLLMGFPGSIVAFGFGKMWIGIGLALGTIANWILVARRLRRFSVAAGDSITIPEYLSNRFASKNPALRIVCAVVFLICFTLYVASAFAAGKELFIDVLPSLADKPNLAMFIFAVILISYTFLGGFKAVCYTDFFQGIMMLVAILAVPIIILFTKNLDFGAINSGFEGTANYFVSNPFSATPQDIISGLAWGLGYFGMPHILVRFMGIRKASMVKKSATVASVWVVLSLGAAILIALFGRLLHPELIANGTQETVFIVLSNDLFPPFIAGVLLSAILAAAMSTADSQLLVASSSFTSDIYKTVFRRKASDKEELWIGRCVVIIVAVVAYFIAANPNCGGIMDLVGNAWAGFGAAFGPVILLSLFWRRLTYAGAITGIITGIVTDVLWLNFLSEKTGIYEIVPGFIVCLIAAVAVSLIGPKPSKEVTDIFDAATSAVEE